MKYTKKIIILNEVTSGFSRGTARGVGNIEKTPSRAEASVNIFGLEPLKSGSFIIGVGAQNMKIQKHDAGRIGRINIKFPLMYETDVEAPLFITVVFKDGNTVVPVLFGSNGNRKTMYSNLLDGFTERADDSELGRHMDDIRRNEAEDGRPDKVLYNDDGGNIRGTDRSDDKYKKETVAAPPYPWKPFDIGKDRQDTVSDGDDAGKNPWQSNPQYREQNGLRYGRPVENEDGWSFEKEMRKRLSAMDDIQDEPLEADRNEIEENYAETGPEEEIIAETKIADSFINQKEAVRFQPGNAQKEFFVSPEPVPKKEQPESVKSQPVTDTENAVKATRNENIRGAFEAESGEAVNDGKFDTISMYADTQVAAENYYPEGYGMSEAGFTLEDGIGVNKIDPRKIMIRKPALSFYENVKPQIDELFKKYPPEENLNRKLPGTRWVKVDYNGNGKYYIVGLIGEEPKYICYGVPAKYTAEMPEELENCQWMPSSDDTPEGEGYWLMYQSAETGENVELQIM